MNLQHSAWNTSEFEKNLSQVYETVVFWRKNMFLLPSGKVGRTFIWEVSRLMSEWLFDSPLKDIAFKVIMVMPCLLLQRPSWKSKSKDHLRALEQRLELSESGEVMELLDGKGCNSEEYEGDQYDDIYQKNFQKIYTQNEKR